MTSNVKLLPLPAEIRARDFKWAAVEVYALANVLHHTAPLRYALDNAARSIKSMRGVMDSHAAEIVALRAEVRTLVRQNGEWQARVERLAEAGRRVTAAFRAHGEASSFTRQAERTRHECEAAMLSLDAALRDHDQEAGNG